MIDNRTPRLDLPLPNVDNYLEDDVARLAEALTSLDEKVATVGESGKLAEEQIPESVAVLDSNKKLPASNLPDKAVVTDINGKIPASVVPVNDLGLASDEELSTVAQAAQAADAKAQEALEKGGDPVLAAKWIQKRSAMWKGYAPADGQLLPRSLYPDAVAGIQAGMVPVCTDAEWLADPAKRGCFTLGDGSTTFRLPDYNGVYAGSYGPAYLGGGNANGGAILRDRIQNITAKASQSADWGLVSNIAIVDGALYIGDEETVKNMAGSGQPSSSGRFLKFDASRVARTGETTRPITAEGCIAVRLFGAVQNVGSADAAALATAVAALESRVANLPTAGAFGFRNKIINGNFAVWQRGTSSAGVSSGNSVYTADRFLTYSEGATIYAYQAAAAANMPFIHCLAINAAPGNTKVTISQRVAAMSCDFPTGEAVTFSLYVKSTVARQAKLKMQTTVGAADVWGPGWTNIAEETKQIPADTWVRLSITTAATDDIRKGVQPQIEIAGVQSGSFYTSGWQLESGAVATPLERRPFEYELDLCRFYFNVVGFSFGISYAPSDYRNSTWASVNFNLPMRATPSISGKASGVTNMNATVNPDINASSGIRVSAIHGVQRNNLEVKLGCAATGFPTTGNYCYVSGEVVLNAEL